MKSKKEIQQITISENSVGAGIEKNIYRDPQKPDVFVGVFRNNRRWLVKNEEYDMLRPFHESPNYIKAVYYANQIAEILIPKFIRHISQTGRIPEKNNEDSKHYIVGDGFIKPGKFMPLDRLDSIEVYNYYDDLFKKNGFEIDRQADNIAQNPSNPDEYLYIDSISPWRYKKRGIAHEHKSKKGDYGLGGFVAIYEPIAQYDEEKVRAAIKGLPDENTREKALSFLDRMNVLLHEEQSLWKKKKEDVLTNPNSFWEET